MDQGQRDWVWALSLKCERPVAECESTPNAFLYIKGGQMDNASRAKLMEPHYFSYEWLRGPSKVSCGYSQCPRGQTFEPLHWSRASLGGCAVACAVCHRLGLRGGEASTFCSEHCFLTGWQEHVPMHAGQSFYPRHGARPRDAESLGDDDQKSPPLPPSSTSSSAGAVQNGSNPQQQRHPRTGSSDSLTYDEDEYVAISQDLTYSPTADDVGCRLRIAVTAVAQADGSRLAGPVVITTLPVLSAPRPAPRRAMVQQVSSINLSSSPRFRVVSYNILAELYATRQAYPYADPWSLTWAYRKKVSNPPPLPTPSALAARPPLPPSFPHLPPSSLLPPSSPSPSSSCRSSRRPRGTWCAFRKYSWTTTRRTSARCSPSWASTGCSSRRAARAWASTARWTGARSSGAARASSCRRTTLLSSTTSPDRCQPALSLFLTCPHAVTYHTPHSNRLLSLLPSPFSLTHCPLPPPLFSLPPTQAALELGLDEAEARRYMNRLSRDNVAQVVVLEVIGAPRQARGSTRLCVANTHLYSNVQRPDVKLWQALSLLQELEQFVVQRDLALLLCGDLNR